MDTRGLDFLILGPLDVRAGDRPVAINGPRQRTVLAMLLLNPDRVVSVDTLVDALWHGKPPATGRAQIAICIAGLRKTFRHAGCQVDVIATVHPGYLLRARNHRIDVLDFVDLVTRAERAAQEGRAHEAAETLGAAIALWRGPALAGIPSPAVEAEAGRLEEQRLTAYERRAALMLDLGQHQPLIGELTAQVLEHPLQEKVREHLMLALYRSGRRAEALEVYREGRLRLTEELGLDPGQALRDLQEEMLRDEPSLTLSGPLMLAGDVPIALAQLPADVPTFVGRVPELIAMNALLANDAGQPLPVGLITGAVGVGKTSLALHWAHQVSSDFPDGQLFADLHGYHEGTEPATPAAILDRFLRALGVHSGRIQAELNERIALYRSILHGRRMLIVLDNVSSFAQVQPLLPGGGNCAVLVTSRDQIGELSRHGGVRLRLGALTPDEATTLLSHVAGEDRVAADRAGAIRLGELCDWLPLALQIVGARLAIKPHWSLEHVVSKLTDERQRLDELSQGERSVRASLALSYHRLPPNEALMYRRLSLLDVLDIPAWAGAALLDTSLTEAENVMERLVDMQLLQAADRDSSSTMRFRFQPLVRLDARERAQEEDDPIEQRAALERAFGCWLDLAEQAHRRAAGGVHTLIHHGRAARWPLPPRYVDSLVHDPLGWFEVERLPILSVISQAVKMDLDELAWDLAMTTITLFETRHYPDDWHSACTSALGGTRRAGNRRGEAAMLYALGSLKALQQHYDEAEVFFAAALELFDQVAEDHGRALVLRGLGETQLRSGRLSEAETTLTEALRAARVVSGTSR